MRQIKNHTRCEFRIESNRTLRNPHWAVSAGKELLVHDRSLAVAMAAKTRTVPCEWGLSAHSVIVNPAAPTARVEPPYPRLAWYSPVCPSRPLA